MGGVAAGAAGLVDTDLVLFCYVEAVVAVPPEVLPFLLLDPLGLARTGLLGVGCGRAGVGASATCPSAVMKAMMSSNCLASVGVRVTLVAAASSSASTWSVSSLEVEGVVIFSLPLLERTGMGGSSRSFSESFSASMGELSVVDLSPSSSG